jgi:lysine-specific demethylase 8
VRVSGRDVIDALARAARGFRPPPPAASPERVCQPTAERFSAVRHAALPVRIDGLTEQWPGRANLTLPRLRERFGDRVVSGSPTKDGRLVCDPRTGLAFQTVRLGEYIERLERSDWPAIYLHGPGDTWLPELNDDVRPPECCRSASWRVSRFWLSAPQMSSPLHRHAAENIFVQLIGRKRVYLYPPGATAWLYSNPVRSALPNYSRFDPEQPDDRRFPRTRNVRPLELILEAGDALYIPSGWWHQVRSLDVSLSWNFFFADGWVALGQRAMELLKRLRGLEIYGLEQRIRAGEKAAAR